MRCTEGHKNDDRLKYCGECGLQLVEQDSTSLEGGNDAVVDADTSPVPTPVVATEGFLSTDAESAGAPWFAGRRKWAAIGAFIGFGVLLAVFRVSSGSPSLSGSIAVTGNIDASVDFMTSRAGDLDDVLDALQAEGLDCSQGLGGGFSDLRTGAAVIVRDSGETIIASGSLDAGHALGNGPVVCTFTFSIDLPSSDFYQVTIGNRSAGTYSRDQLDEQGWQIDLTIG